MNRSNLDRLANAIALGIHAGPVEEVAVPVTFDSAIGEHRGTRIQIMRVYDIQLDEFLYRVFLLKSSNGA